MTDNHYILVAFGLKKSFHCLHIKNTATEMDLMMQLSEKPLSLPFFPSIHSLCEKKDLRSLETTSRWSETAKIFCQGQLSFFIGYLNHQLSIVNRNFLLLRWCCQFCLVNLFWGSKIALIWSWLYQTEFHFSWKTYLSGWRRQASGSKLETFREWRKQDQAVWASAAAAGWRDDIIVFKRKIGCFSKLTFPRNYWAHGEIVIKMKLNFLHEEEKSLFQ